VIDTSSPAIVVVGSNHECASIDLRERMTFSGETLRHALRSLRERVDEALILSTCNRTELYVADRDPERARAELASYLVERHGISAEVLRNASYAFTGETAVAHLFRVASGLDSLVLGEPQILAQIRDALADAREAGAAGPLLTRLATDGLHAGKRARTDTSIARNRLSIAHAAVELASRQLNGLAGRRAVVIGAGKMATLAAKLLRGASVADLTVVNRSEERGATLAASVGGRSCPIERLAEAVAGADLVVAAILADEPQLRPEHLPVGEHALCVVDLGVPRIVHPGVREQPNVAYFDIDALESVTAETRRQYEGEIAKVERLIGEAVEDYVAWVRGRSAAAVIREMRDAAETMREAELERALRRLHHLSERDQNVVRALSVGLTNKLLHHPVAHLREQPDPAEVALARRLYGVADGD
jgi:glutamyl-tRNA reductase